MPQLVYSKRRIEYDPVIVKEQLHMLNGMLKQRGMEAFCRLAPVWILRKEAESEEEEKFLKRRYAGFQKKLVPFFWNQMQRELYANLAQNNILLKYRQGGATTWFIIVRLLLNAILEPGTSALLISQTKIYGAKHFEILRRTHRHFGKIDPSDDSKNQLSIWLHQHLLHTQASNRHEIIYDAIDSRVMCDTAENPEVGQGLPGVNHFVGTEVSRWPHDPRETMANVTESVSPRGTKDHEWTANGMQGYAFEEYKRAKNGESNYKAHFYPWPYGEEYTLEDIKDRKRWINSEDDYTEEEKKRVKLFHLNIGQVAWRRMKIADLGDDFMEKYPEDDESCFLLIGGRPFFERLKVRENLMYVRANVKPVDVGANGAFRIYRAPVSKRRYILFADCAKGETITTTEPDFCAFSVIDEIDGFECASYHERIVPDQYAEVIEHVAVMYNQALVGVENNPGGSGETVLYVLDRQLSYWNLFKHKFWYKKPNAQGKQEIGETLGLPTSQKTRPIMLNMLATTVREHPEQWVDEIFWSECSTFIYDEKGVPRGADGCYDDTVLCRAGATYVRLVQMGVYDPLHATSQRYGERVAAVM